MVRFNYNLLDTGEEDAQPEFASENLIVNYGEPGGRTDTTTRETGSIHERELLHYLPGSIHDRELSRYRRSHYYYILGAVLVAWLYGRYGPPTPPPGSDMELQTWTEFTFMQTTRFLSFAKALKELCEAVLFATKWTLEGLYYEVWGLGYGVHVGLQDWYQGWRRPMCSLMVPGLGLPEEWLSTRIVEQRRAVVTVSTALDAWDIGETNRNKPLLLLLTGREGVGKMEMARQVARMVFQNCPVNHDHGIVRDEMYLDDGVLILHGVDYAAADASGDRSILHVEEKLFWRIGDHIRKRRGNGSVVIIQHIEKIPPGVLKRLCQQIRAPEPSLSYSREVQRRGDLPRKPIRISLGNDIFIFTTNVGRKAISRSILTFGALQNMPQLDLTLSLQEEIDVHLGEGEGELGKLFNTVVPFVPLGRSALERILHQKVENLSSQRSGQHWKQLVLSEAAIETFVSDEYVEYIEVETVDYEKALSFSIKGGKTVETGSTTMNLVKSSVKRCLPDARPLYSAVMDVDSAAREALLCWCEDESSSCDASSCQPFCRFPL